jgi:hypothetical protein
LLNKNTTLSRKREGRTATKEQVLEEKAGHRKIKADQADNMHFAITAGPAAQDPCMMWARGMNRHRMSEDERGAN